MAIFYLAMQTIKFLGILSQQLQKSYLFSQYLENNLNQSFNIWLQIFLGLKAENILKTISMRSFK